MILYREIGWSQYEPREEDAELFQRICDQGKLNELEDYLVESSGSEYVNERDVDDLLWHEEPFVIKLLGLDMSDTGDDEGYDGELLYRLGQWVFRREDCPPGATCAAVDACGDAYWYSGDPNAVVVEEGMEHWSATGEGRLMKPIWGDFDTSDWQHSKIIREEKK